MKNKAKWENGFEPIIDKNSKVLILGSFPSVKSRLQGFYYGNPQNRFWKMLEKFFNMTILNDIESKKQFLLKNNIAVWDSIKSCKISGSADSDITKENSIPVDMNKLLKDYPNIKSIICNGKKSYSMFMQFNSDCLVEVNCLPSTSPANVSYNYEAWQQKLSEIFN